MPSVKPPSKNRWRLVLAEADRIEMRVFNPSAEPADGFGMLLSNKRAVPADFNATMIGLPVKK